MDSNPSRETKHLAIMQRLDRLDTAVQSLNSTLMRIKEDVSTARDASMITDSSKTKRLSLVESLNVIPDRINNASDMLNKINEELNQLLF